MDGQQAGRRRRAGRRAVTIVEVAARAGVSTATVSRTLAMPDVVSPEARARVLEAIAATGYTPNVAARNLRARRTMMVLVVVPDIANPFFAEILRGIDDELVASGYGMIIGNLDNQVEREARYVDLVFAGQVDGVLLLSCRRVPAGDGRLLTDAGLPVATVNVGIPEAGLPHVGVNDREASRAVAEHLLALGHRRFGHIAGPPLAPDWLERQAGFLAGLAAAGIEAEAVVRWPGDFMFEAGTLAGRDFLARPDRPTAVFAASDHMAIGFMKTVIAAGLAVPEDVSVVGFDAIEFADYVHPTLTTVRQPRHEMGRTGARILLQALAGEGRPEGPVKLAAPLLLRDSTAPPRAAAPAPALSVPLRAG